MPYSNAVFFMDYANGSDAARTALTSVAFADNGSGGVRCTKTAHGLVTGAIVVVSVISAYAGTWKVTKITDDIFDLDSAIYSSGGSGTVTPQGGASWADAKKTLNFLTTAFGQCGDVVKVAKSPDPYAVGNATWTQYSNTITLATAQTITVALCESAWTAANGAAAAAQTARKQGSYSMRITAPSSTATATLYAYSATGLLDLSPKQTLSFLLRNSAVVATGNWKLCLCSDTAGAVIVDTFKIPALSSAVTGSWIPLTLTKDGGGNLSSNIQSVALYSDTVAPTGSSYLQLDCIIACASGGLNLNSLITKSPLAQSIATSEPAFCIRSIVGTAVTLDGAPQSDAYYAASFVYCGATETVATYAREVIQTLVLSGSASVHSVQASGSPTAYLSIQGGYNTSTGAQDGETVFSGNAGYGVGITVGTSGTGAIIYGCYVEMNLISAVRYGYGLQIYGSGFHGQVIPNLNSNYYYGILLYGNALVIDAIVSASMQTDGSSGGSSYGGIHIFGSNARVNYAGWVCCSPNGIYLGSGFHNFICASVVAYNTYNIYLAGGSCLLSGAYLAGTYGCYSNGGGIVYLHNCAVAATSEFEWYTRSLGPQGVMHSDKHDQTEGNNWTFEYGGTINSQTAVVRTAGNTAWRAVITSSYRGLAVPLRTKLATVAVNSGSLVTAAVYCKKDDASAIGAALVCRGLQIAGVNADVAATKGNDTDWQKLTITFTPSEAGVVEIEGLAYYVSGTGNVYFEQIEVTQA